MALIEYFNHKLCQFDRINTYSSDENAGPDTIQSADVQFFATALTKKKDHVIFKTLSLHGTGGSGLNYHANKGAKLQTTQANNLNNTQLPYHLVIYTRPRDIVLIDDIKSLVNSQLDKMQRIDFSPTKNNALSEIVQLDKQYTPREHLTSDKYHFSISKRFFSEDTESVMGTLGTHNIVSHDIEELMSNVIPYAWQNRHFDFENGKNDLINDAPVDLGFTSDRLTEIKSFRDSDAEDLNSDLFATENGVVFGIIAPTSDYLKGADFNRDHAYKPKSRITLDTNIGLVGVTIVPTST